MSSLWQLEDLTARLALPSLRGDVALATARPGLAQLVLAGQELGKARLLTVELEHPSPADGIGAYVRQGDLVATFEETPARRVRVQAYWRTAWAAEIPQLLAGVDLEVSVQTSLLDSDPRLVVSSLVSAAEIWQLDLAGKWQRLPAQGDVSKELLPDTGTGCLLFRTWGDGASYVEMTHPADFRAVRLSGEGDGTNVIRPLFGRDLEKGVILRSRIRGGFAPRAIDQAVALQAWLAFTESPIPLTT